MIGQHSTSTLTNQKQVILVRQIVLPSRIKVSKRVDHIAPHRGNDGPFAAQVFDNGGRKKHGGQDDGGEADA